MTLEEKLALWVKITGVNPQEKKTHYTIYMDGRLSNYDVEKMNNRIQKSLSYDETGLFAEAYLCTYFEEYLKKKKMSLYECITNKDSSAYMDDLRTLYNELQESNASELIMAEAAKAMDFYDLAHDKLEIFDVVELRTSATNCINGKLTLMQFKKGAVANTDFKLCRDIYVYKDVEQILNYAANGQMDGVSLCYIKNEEKLTDSFFAFAIKNGQNLYLLSDIPSYVHPLQKNMSRCPGRDMYNRIESNWFPYETLSNINISDLWGYGRYGTSEKDENAVVVQAERIKIGTIQDLNQHEAFWMVAMLSEIKKKFYADVLPETDLYYTGNMISHPAIEANKNALTVIEEFPHITLTEVTDPENVVLEYEYESLHINDYLVERYKDKVNTEVYNLVSVPEDNTQLGALNTSECATKEQLERNQKWLARYNFACEIQRLIEDDYKKNRNDVIDSVRELITKRLRQLVIDHLQGKLVGSEGHEVNAFGYAYDGQKRRQLSELLLFDDWYNGYFRGNYRYGYDALSNKIDMRCAFTDAKPGVAVSICNIKNAEDLALVCGCEVKDLPIQIQNYTKGRVYTGNNFLNDIDPMDWAIKDDWNDMKFGINILISKKEYLVLCEEAGVPAEKFWLSEKPTCFHYVKNEGSCYGERRSYRDNSFKKKCEKCKYFESNYKKEQKQEGAEENE